MTRLALLLLLSGCAAPEAQPAPSPASEAAPLVDIPWDEALQVVTRMKGGAHAVWFDEHGRRAYVEYTCSGWTVDEMPDRGWLDRCAVRVWPVALVR